MDQRQSFRCSGKKCSFLSDANLIQIRNLVKVDKIGNLELKYSFILNDLLDAARINATFIKSNAIGSCASSGVYDGLIGTLERNESDFAIDMYSLESIMNARCRTPVLFDAIYRQQSYYVYSCPDTNVTKSYHGVHESLFVFDATAAMFLIGVFFCSLLLLAASSLVSGGRRHFWKLTKIWLFQDANDDAIRVHSKRVTLTASKLIIAQLVFVIGALFSTDLVSYSRPTLINSVADAIDSGINVALSKTASAYPVLSAEPEGTLGDQFLKHAHKLAANRSVELFFPTGHEVTVNVRKRTHISVTGETGKLITDRLNCLSSAKGANYFHTSKETVTRSHDTIFFSRSCHAQIRKRIARLMSRAMETGLISKSHNDVPEKITDANYQESVSVHCLYRDKHESNFIFRSVSYSGINELILILIKCYCACAIVLLLEHFIWTRTRKQRIVRHNINICAIEISRAN